MARNPVEHASSHLGLAGEIVAAYVSRNSVPAAELPTLIAKVHAAVADLAAPDASGTAAQAVAVENPTAAQIRRSVRDGGILSFIVGEGYKTLKRHLSANELDPRGYRERYGLPAN